MGFVLDWDGRLGRREFVTLGKIIIGSLMDMDPECGGSGQKKSLAAQALSNLASEDGKYGGY